MKPLCESLENQFTIFNLGCIGDVDYQLPGSIVGYLLVEGVSGFMNEDRA